MDKVNQLINVLIIGIAISKILEMQLHEKLTDFMFLIPTVGLTSFPLYCHMRLAAFHRQQ